MDVDAPDPVRVEVISVQNLGRCSTKGTFFKFGVEWKGVKNVRFQLINLTEN